MGLKRFAVLLLFGVGGLRRIDQRQNESSNATILADSEAGASSSVVEHPASLSCFLGCGFSTQKGCQITPALSPISSCDKAGIGEACERDSKTEVVKIYTRDVRTSKDYSELTESITEAEGGGYGVSVSAGFSYLKKSKVSEKSTAFFIGASGRAKISHVDHPQSLKLTAAAKQLLKSNASEFLQVYGSTFVHTLTYGGSFLGSVTINSKDTSDGQDVGAFTNISVDRGVFSARGSTSFQNAKDNTTGSVDIFLDSTWTGGSVPPEVATSPQQLGDLFKTWGESWSKTPVALTLVTRRYYDLHQVQKIVHELPADQQMLFRADLLDPTMHKKISVESAEIMKIEGSVEQALSWLATEDDPKMKKCLNDLSHDIAIKRININGMTDSDALAIQVQYMNRDFSWFQFKKYHSRYVACVGNADKVCVGSSNPCKTWQELHRDTRVDWCLRNYTCGGVADSPSRDKLSHIARISESNGQDHIGLRDELRTNFPGWEWIVARFRKDNGPGYAISGSNWGLAKTSYRTFIMGAHCPSAPKCVKCYSSENCIAESLKGGVSSASVGKAQSDCHHGGTSTRSILGVDKKTMSWAAYKYDAGRSCIAYGSRHNHWYAFSVSPKSTTRIVAGEPKPTLDDHQPKCMVTTHSEKHCRGSRVGTYESISEDGQEWKWGSGNQENKPVSAKLSGECAKVELYDEDDNRAGHGDNWVARNPQHGYCYNLKWDIENDLGGLKIWAR